MEQKNNKEHNQLFTQFCETTTTSRASESTNQETRFANISLVQLELQAITNPMLFNASS